eukprot:6997674-Prymnesium_polylepis.1
MLEADVKGGEIGPSDADFKAQLSRQHRGAMRKRVDELHQAIAAAEPALRKVSHGGHMAVTQPHAVQPCA